MLRLRDVFGLVVILLFVAGFSYFAYQNREQSQWNKIQKENDLLKSEIDCLQDEKMNLEQTLEECNYDSCAD